MKHQVRCSVCFRHVSSPQKLANHYLNTHKKTELVKQLLKTDYSNIPKVLKAKKKKTKAIYVRKDLTMDCDNNNIEMIESNDQNNSIEIDLNQSCHLEVNNNKSNLVDEALKQSLNDKNGDYYICNCMHNSSNPIFCKVCCLMFNTPEEYSLHLKQHLLTIFMCHFCGMKFINEESFKEHLNRDFELHTLETVLDLEQDYHLYYPYDDHSDYLRALHSILWYLKYPCEQCFYCQKQTITCEYCGISISTIEYDVHLRLLHNV